MSMKVTLLLSFFFVFYTTLVAAGRLERRQPFPNHLVNTNAKRMALGLSPLPPRRRSTSVDTAKKPKTSPVASNCHIEVQDLNDKKLGHLSKDLKDGHYTLHKEGTDGDAFSTHANNASYGKSEGISFIDSEKPGYYLAGIITQGATLGPESNGFATLGASSLTKPGVGPQSDTNPTIPGVSETAIFKYYASGNRITATWMNNEEAGGGSSTVYFFYDKQTDTFFLAGSSMHISYPQVNFYLDCCQ